MTDNPSHLGKYVTADKRRHGVAAIYHQVAESSGGAGNSQCEGGWLSGGDSAGRVGIAEAEGVKRTMQG